MTMTARAQSTPVQRKSQSDAATSAPETSNDPRAVQRKQALRGMTFDEGEQALLPPGEGESDDGKGAVQLKGALVQMRGKKNRGNRGGGGGGGSSGSQTGGGRVQTPPQTTTPSNEGALKKIASKIGEVASVEAAFEAIGGLIDLMAPISGQGFSGSVDVKIKPPGGSGFYLNLNLEGTAKRNVDDKLELEGKVAIVLGAVGGLSEWFSGYVGARGMIAVKATADGGIECLRLLGLGIHRTMAAWSTKGADWLFGGGYEKDVVKGMTPETEGGKADSLEYTGELGAEGGVGAKPGQEGVEGKMALGYRGKHKLSKEKSGDTTIKAETEHGFMLNLVGKGKAGGLEIEGGVDMFLTSAKPPQWELKAEVAADADKMKDRGQIAKLLGDAIGGMTGVYRSALSLQEKAAKGDKSNYAKARTALGGLATFPKATAAMAMHKQGSKAPLGTKPAFELGLKFEGTTLQEFNIEALQKFELPEGAKDALGTAGVEIGGKQSTNILSQK